MAKNKSDNGGVNKSAAIREVLSQNPHTPTQEVVATLSGKGIKAHGWGKDSDNVQAAKVRVLLPGNGAYDAHAATPDPRHRARRFDRVRFSQMGACAL